MKCMNCQMVNPDGARFCGNCGTTMGATTWQNRTKVMPSGVLSSVNDGPLSCDIVKTVVQRVNETLGEGRPGSMLAPEAADLTDQREHTVIVQDVSGSMGESFSRDGVNKLNAAKRACVDLVLAKHRGDPNDRVGLVTFNSKAKVLMPLSPLATSKRPIVEAIESLSPYNGTDINEGLLAAEGLFDWNRGDVVPRVVLLTDGRGGDPVATAGRLKSRRAVIDVVAVGDSPASVNEELLRLIGSSYRFLKDSQDFRTHVTHLAGKTQTR